MPEQIKNFGQDFFECLVVQLIRSPAMLTRSRPLAGCSIAARQETFFTLAGKNKAIDWTFTLRYKASMKSIRRTIAIIELLLVLPAALFMTALFVRDIQPAPYQPAESARRIVEWFSARPHLGLGVLLIALPFAAFVIGCTTVLRSWANDAKFRRAILGALAAVCPHLAKVLIAGTTLLAGGILAIVALHMITD